MVLSFVPYEGTALNLIDIKSAVLDLRLKPYSGSMLFSSIVHGGTGTFFHNIGCDLISTCTRSYIMGRELIPPCVTISWNNFMENAMVQSECYHILEQFDETICLFKLIEMQWFPVLS